MKQLAAIRANAKAIAIPTLQRAGTKDMEHISHDCLYGPALANAEAQDLLEFRDGQEGCLRTPSFPNLTTRTARAWSRTIEGTAISA